LGRGRGRPGRCFYLEPLLAPVATLPQWKLQMEWHSEASTSFKEDRSLIKRLRSSLVSFSVKMIILKGILQHTPE
jgi:hypothetical protein